MRLKIRALLETTLVVFLMAGVFKLVSLFASVFSQRPDNLSRAMQYMAMLVITLGGLLLSQKNLGDYGVLLGWGKADGKIFAAAFFPVLAISAALSQVDWSTWGGALLVSGLALAMLFIVAWLLKKLPTAGASSGLTAGLLLASMLIWQGAGSRLGQALWSLFYFYLLVAPAEELFFRGYIQSRLNQAFGRPYLFLGVPWGWGWIIASLLFGLWHVVWNPFALAGWLHGLWTFFVGLLFGYIREKSGSVMAPAWLHGVLNYSPLALFFD